MQWVVLFRDPARVTLTKMAEDQIYTFDSDMLREAATSTVALARWVGLRYAWHTAAGGALGSGGTDDDDEGTASERERHRRDLRPRTLLWWYEDLETQPLSCLKSLARFLRWDPEHLNESSMAQKSRFLGEQPSSHPVPSFVLFYLSPQL